MSDVEKRDHEARIAWLEAEVGRLAAKVDKAVSMEGFDVPTPKPAINTAGEAAK